jgi:hypothetical protein
METLEQNNRMIAEFDGWVYEPGSGFWLRPVGNAMVPAVRTPLDMNFHRYWGELMPVVEKIYTLQDYRHCEAYYIVTHMFIINPIEVVYQAVINFITWYNTKENGK